MPEPLREKRTKEKEDCGSEGTALGICFGIGIGSALHINVGYGRMAGMVLGLLIGSGIEKKQSSGNEAEDERR